LVDASIFAIISYEIIIINMIKNNFKKILLFVILGVLIVVFASFFVVEKFSWKAGAIKVIEASGSCPYQIGLTNVFQTPCVISVDSCTPGPLCKIKDPASCTAYSEVSGVPAGGMGQNALFLKTSIAQAGLPLTGGQLIACGSSPAFMDNGVLASYGGCAGAGCLAMTNRNFFEKFYDSINYIIAGFRD